LECSHYRAEGSEEGFVLLQYFDKKSHTKKEHVGHGKAVSVTKNHLKTRKESDKRNKKRKSQKA